MLHERDRWLQLPGRFSGGWTGGAAMDLLCRGVSDGPRSACWTNTANASPVSSLLLFLIYFPRTTGLEAPGTVPEGTPSLRTATLVTIISVVHFVVFAAISFYLSLLTSEPTPHEPTSPAPPSRTLVAYANFLGVQSMVLASLQYVPQIMTTWRLKHVGSLSIPMMLIQTPGSFIWAISLATREGTKWSSWLTYVVTGVLQGGLLVMCISWELRERAERKKILDAIDADVAIRTGANGAADAERRPLLADER